MNTQGIIVLVIAVVVVLGGVWFFSSKNGASLPGTENASTGSGTFAALMGMTGSLKCDVATAAGDMQSSGTVYISNGQMRGDFNSTTKGSETVTEAHMIRAGGFMYSWTSAAPQGVKIADSVVASSSASGGNKAAIDPNTNVTYSCAPWVSDAAQFVPPTSVTFIDVSAMMQGGAMLPKGAIPSKDTTYPSGNAANPYNY